MDVTPPLAPSETNQVLRPLPPEVDAYLARLGFEQRRFLGALGEANRDLSGSAGQITKVAAIQARLTHEFLDAQRAIIKRRAETDAEIAEIAENADRDAAALLVAARSRACIAIGRPLPSPSTGSWAAPLPLPVPTVRPSIAESPGRASDSLVQLIDGAFEATEPDGVAARRELRGLLDAWWEAENQEAKAAVDDAAARAAMYVHVAKVEAGEIARFGPPSTTTEAPAVHRYQAPTALPTPMVSALDATDHAHLDDVLAHLLDELDDHPSPRLWPAPAGSDAPDTTLDDPTELWAVPVHAKDAAPAVAPPADSLNDRTAAPQEAFDRFWGSFGVPGNRRWMFPQLLLPAVSVIAVLALVLAVIG